MHARLLSLPVLWEKQLQAAMVAAQTHAVGAFIVSFGMRRSRVWCMDSGDRSALLLRRLPEPSQSSTQPPSGDKLYLCIPLAAGACRARELTQVHMHR